MIRLGSEIDAAESTHYEILGLDRNCTQAQVRDAYRQLAKRYHPDVNRSSSDAGRRIQALNQAHEVLSDAARRRAYDRELDGASRAAANARSTRLIRSLTQEVRLRIDDFIRGRSLNVQVNDPGNVDGPEVFELNVPPDTAPGARFRLPRSGAFEGGLVELRLKVLPGSRFKVRGSDLHCDLRISSDRARSGGTESIQSPTGGVLRVSVPARVKRGETISLPGHGMPKPRGGRGNLVVRVTYRPDVRVSRSR